MVRIELSLLDLLAMQMGCTYLSDLRYLNGLERQRLIQKLTYLSPCEEDIKSWNDALDYLTGAPPEQTAAMAKSRLTELLRCSARSAPDGIREKGGNENEK